MSEIVKIKVNGLPHDLELERLTNLGFSIKDGRVVPDGMRVRFDSIDQIISFCRLFWRTVIDGDTLTVICEDKL